VFAYEAKSLGTEGQRRYLVAAFHEFANMYRKVPQSKRHVYEVIPENTPCRLYFDLEFKKTLNPTIDESRAVRILETFIQYICYQVQLHFRLSINRTNVLDLDSSSDSKFSRHLIFHLPGAAFENNKEAGSFVHYVCDQLRVLRQASPGKGSSISETLEPVYHDLFPVPAGKQSSAPCPKAHCLMELFVKDSEDQAVLFCDEAVYSKNRNFRLHLSTKLGCLDRCLRIAKENTFKSMFESQRHRQSTQHINILMDSLVSYVRFHDNIRILTFESPCSKSASKLAHPQPISPGYSASDGYSQSPFPNVDRYVVNEWTKGGIVPIIRKWTYFPQDKILVYDVLKSKWCENVQRHHKSNNVYIVVNLQMGLYYQKCYDPDCRRIGFKSKEYPIPDDVNPINNITAGHEDSLCEDDLLLDCDDFMEEFLKPNHSEEDIDSEALAEFLESFNEDDPVDCDFYSFSSDKDDELFSKALEEFEQCQ
jgi:hypothetical protein